MATNSSAHNPVCADGVGSFEAQSPTGTRVHIGPSKIGELASRDCDAVLDWNKLTLRVATHASEIDLDTFGADLGLGAPVASFQAKAKASPECCREYRLYSLGNPPRLLRTLTGGAHFKASDVDLDGRVEIWTDDAAAIDGFEGLNLAEMNPPTVVLRFEQGRLLDVSREFQSYFDREIQMVREQLSPQELRDFKSSDGALTSGASMDAERMHVLRSTKAKVLQIVWAYLYSGREKQAWRSLEEMWPASDAARIRASIVAVRAHGIASQIDGVSETRVRKKRKAVIFDAINQSTAGKLDVTPPQAITLTRPALLGAADSSQSESVLTLVIDSAGKVRSAEAVGTHAPDQALIDAAMQWKFIPAFKDGHPVASRTRLSVSLKQ